MMNIEHLISPTRMLIIIDRSNIQADRDGVRPKPNDDQTPTAVTTCILKDVARCFNSVLEAVVLRRRNDRYDIQHGSTILRHFASEGVAV